MIFVCFVLCCMISYTNFPKSSFRIGYTVGRHFKKKCLVTGQPHLTRAAPTNEIARNVIATSKFILIEYVIEKISFTSCIIQQE